MAGEDRTPPHLVELLEQLQDEPFAFDFFQAIRLLDCARPDTPPTGHSTSLKDDPFRIGQEPSMAFAPAALSDLEPGDDFHPPRLIQRFLGMMGPQGPLPTHLTDYAYSRIHHHRDYTFARFLDVFHHRMLTLFYRAWARVRPTVEFDRGSNDRFSDYVGSVFGLGMPSLIHRDAFPDLPKLHFSGIMGCQTKHAEGLLDILSGYFCLPVDIEQFVGQWIELPGDCQCRMGLSPLSSTLGQTVAIGSHVWDCQQKFRVIFGPLQLEDYFNLLPVNAVVVDDSESDSGVRHEPAAETVFVNGRIYTANGRRPWAEAVAVRQGKFVVVGSHADVLNVSDDSTEVIDLDGALVIPGFHPESSSLVGTNPVFVEGQPALTRQQFVVAIRRAASQAVEGTWLTGGSWPLESFGVDAPRDLIDEFVPQHPVCLRDAGGRVAWANSLALEMAQLTAETADPPDGKIGRETATGNCTGVLQDAAIRLVEQQIPAPSETESASPSALPKAERWMALERTVQLAASGDESDKLNALERAIRQMAGEQASGASDADQAVVIENGAYADMTVVNQDLFELVRENQVDRLHQTRASRAVYDGDIVFDGANKPSVTGERPTTGRKADRITGEPGSSARAGGRRETDRETTSHHASLDSLIALVRGYVGDDLQWDLQLILAKQDAPPLGLGMQGHLGWSTWLLQNPMDRDCHDLILDAMNAQADSEDKLEYQRIQDWDHRTLARGPDGRAVLSKVAST